MNVICTSEEGVSALIPVGKGVFRRLFTLQNEMVNTLPQNCALDPREFRMLKTNAKRRCGRPDKKKWKKSFLDAFSPLSSVVDRPGRAIALDFFNIYASLLLKCRDRD
ncbi:hypothetical protein PInf_020441 [Phytophthora infestans]|nr:hypothetical protein PInf_020441 [Phytophthora infestans]